MLRELQERGIAEGFKVYRLSHVTLDDAWWKATLRRIGTSIEEVPALCGSPMPLGDIRTGVKDANAKPDQPRVSPCSKCEERLREVTASRQSDRHSS